MAEKLIQYESSKEFDPSIPKILPHEKIFSIQVGHQLFRVSGASLSSDAPSYFTKFFKEAENDDKVLFIDRSHVVFEKIYYHLQGYPIDFKNEYEFMHLWSDSYYFGLKKLQTILSTGDMYANIGSKSFRMPRSLFISTGNHPNFFSISYDALLTDNVKLIEMKNMIRPLPQKPPNVPHRSPALFSDLLEIMKGNCSVIKDDEHRGLLVLECRYYRFLELEQRLIKHKIINNSLVLNSQEIMLNLFDIQKRGLTNDSKSLTAEIPLQYKRPHLINEPKRSLIVQVDTTDGKINSDWSEATLILNKSQKMALVKLSNKFCSKFLSLFGEFTDEFMTENKNSENPSVSSYVGLSNCDAVINGMKMSKTWATDLLGGTNLIESILPTNSHHLEEEPVQKRRKISVSDVKGDVIEIKLTKSIFKVLMRQDLARLHALKLEGITDAAYFNHETVSFL